MRGSTPVLLAISLGLGCGSRGSGGDTAPGTATEESDTVDPSTGDTNTGGTATGTDTSSGVACEDRDEAGCSEIRSPNDLPCSWQTFTPVKRTGDTCEEMAPVSMCVEMSGDTTATGCGSAPGCEEAQTINPHYKELDDGTVLIGDYCGGSPPTDWQQCETGQLDATPGECACLCEIKFPPGGSGTGP